MLLYSVQRACVPPHTCAVVCTATMGARTRPGPGGTGEQTYVPRPPGVTTRSLDIVSQMMMEVIRWNASWARGWGPSVSLRVRDSKGTASTSVATSAKLPTTNKEGRGFYLPTQD